MLAFLLTIEDPKKRNYVTELYRKYEKPLRKWINYMLESKYLAYSTDLVDDIIQSVFLKIVKYLDNIYNKEEELYVKRYLFRIARNETVNYLMDEEHYENLDDYENLCIEEDALFAELEDLENYQKIVNAIMELDAKYSSVLGLYYSNERSVSEISELLGISDKTVYTRLYRGIKQVRKKLGIGDNK